MEFEELKILLAEDSKPQQKVLINALNSMGITQIAVANDGVEARDLIEEQDFDLVISDWYMPKMDGDELLRYIRKESRCPDLPFLMMTSKCEYGGIISILSDGANDYMVKPPRKGLIREKIIHIFSQKEGVESRRAKGEDPSLLKDMRQKARELVVDEHAFIFSLMNSISDSIFIFSRHGLVERINRSASTLIDRGEDQAIGHPISEFLKLEMNDVRGVFRELESQDQVSVRAQLLNSEELNSLLVTFSRIENGGSDRSTQYVASVKSIQNEINIQRSMANLERWKSLGVMASGVAHEINNPLAILKGHAELIQKIYPKNIDPKNIEKSLGKIFSMVDRIVDIVNGLTRMSRTGSQEKIKNCSVAQMLEDSFSICKEKFKRKNIQVSFEVEPELYAHGVQTRISQVLLNLFVNAYDEITDDKGWVEVKAYSENNSVFVKVIDCGKGIPENQRERIFEPFFTTKDPGSGTGLGLSISRTLIEESSGRLYVDASENHTCFVIELGQGEPEIVENLKFQPEGCIVAAKSILLVDDEADILELASFRLESEGYRVITEQDPTRVLDVLKRESIDLVVSDIRMPKMDGIELLQAIREQYVESPKVVFLTGSVHINLEVIFDLGSEAIFEKPIDFDMLTKALKEILTEKEGFERRRKFQRFDQSIEIRVDIEGVITESKLSNIGRGGLFVNWPEAKIPEIGSEVHVSYDYVLSGERFMDQGSGQVVWARESLDEDLPRGFGVKFLDMKHQDPQAFLWLLNHLKKTSFIPRS